MNDRNLLVVSNDRRTRSTLASILADKGGEVDLASTSACALDYAHEKAYDVAIIDEWLEKMRGPELFERIESCQAGLRGILCCDRPTVVTIETAIESGMDHVVQKPIDKAEILSLVKGES